MRKETFKLLLIGAMAAAAVGAATGAPARASDLVVYTGVEADELKRFEKAFAAVHPEIKIKWVRDSTGVITSKLLAEKSNPQADIVWGLAATSLVQLAHENYFQPYAPAGVDAVLPQYKDSASPPVWVGQRAWAAAVCFNTVEAAKRNIPAPRTWQDLANPVYKGQIVMPNPNSSGTGLLDVTSWMQLQGEEKAWAYMDKLHENVAVYVHSGSKPCKMAAAGEYVVGISMEYRGAELKKKGAPIDVIYPSEGLGWELESFAIVKGAKNLANAKAFADWSTSKDAAKIYNETFAVLAIPGIAQPVQYVPDDLEQRMIKNDFNWIARNRERILDTWQKRYGAKSEKS